MKNYYQQCYFDERIELNRYNKNSKRDEAEDALLELDSKGRYESRFGPVTKDKDGGAYTLTKHAYTYTLTALDLYDLLSGAKGLCNFSPTYNK
jgi:hypothetical protein